MVLITKCTPITLEVSVDTLPTWMTSEGTSYHSGSFYYVSAYTFFLFLSPGLWRVCVEWMRSCTWRGTRWVCNRVKRHNPHSVSSLTCRRWKHLTLHHRNATTLNQVRNFLKLIPMHAICSGAHPGWVSINRVSAAPCNVMDVQYAWYPFSECVWGTKLPKGTFHSCPFHYIIYKSVIKCPFHYTGTA